MAYYCSERSLRSYILPHGEDGKLALVVWLTCCMHTSMTWIISQDYSLMTHGDDSERYRRQDTICYCRGGITDYPMWYDVRLPESG